MQLAVINLDTRLQIKVAKYDVYLQFYIQKHQIIYFILTCSCSADRAAAILELLILNPRSPLYKTI